MHFLQYSKKLKGILSNFKLQLTNKMVRMTNETRPIQSISNDFYKLDIGMKQSILEELMKMFIADKRKIPTRLLTDLKEVRKDNKRGEGYTLHTDCKNTRKALKIYYKQYKHLDKYYPKNLDSVMSVGSLQRGQRAVDIEKKYERLIRFKYDSHIWLYNDESDTVSWIKPVFLKLMKQCNKQENIKPLSKTNFKIGDVEWYGLIIEKGDNVRINYGLTSLANEMIYGTTAVFDNKKSRDDYFDWMMK